MKNIGNYVIAGAIIITFGIMGITIDSQIKQLATLKQLPMITYHQGYMEGAINVLENIEKGKYDFNDEQWEADSIRMYSNYYSHIQK